MFKRFLFLVLGFVFFALGISFYDMDVAADYPEDRVLVYMQFGNQYLGKLDNGDWGLINRPQELVVERQWTGPMERKYRFRALDGSYLTLNREQWFYFYPSPGTDINGNVIKNLFAMSDASRTKVFKVNSGKVKVLNLDKHDGSKKSVIMKIYESEPSKIITAGLKAAIGLGFENPSYPDETLFKVTYINK